jgi:hypothetical protein
LLSFIPVILIAISALVEPPLAGIFIIKKPSKKNPCDVEVQMLIGAKRVCILEKPIVTVEELEYATDVVYDASLNYHYVDLGISSASVNILNQTISVLPKAEFALVIDGSVICVFTIHERVDKRYIRLGEDLDFKNVLRVRDALRKVKY